MSPRDVIQHSHSPCAPIYEDRTQQETLQQERCTRSEAWDLAKNAHTLNESTKLHSSRLRKVSTSAIFDESRGQRPCGGLRSFNAHAEQERSDFFASSSIAWKLCEDHGYSDEWTSCQKTHLFQNATLRIAYFSLFRSCQPDLPARLRVPPQHRCRRTQCEMILRPSTVTTRTRSKCSRANGEACRTIPQKPKTEIKIRPSIEHGEPIV